MKGIMSADLDSLSPICRYIYGRGVADQCKACLSHVSLCSDDERGTSPVFPAHAQGLSPYQDTRWKHHWCMTTDRLPCCSTQAWILLLAAPVMSSRCLSRTLSTQRRRTSVSCVGPFGKRGTACGIHYSARPDARLSFISIINRPWSPAQQQEHDCY
jgi:hypothetical protein